MVSVDIAAFKGLHALEDLNLGFNRLTELESGVFSDLSAVKILDIQSNKFTEFPEQIFKGLKSLSTLQINQNILNALPWTIFSPSDYSDGHPAQLTLGFLISGHLGCGHCLPCDETSCWLKEASAEYGWLQWRKSVSGYNPYCTNKNQGTALAWADFVCEEQGTH